MIASPAAGTVLASRSTFWAVLACVVTAGILLASCSSLPAVEGDPPKQDAEYSFDGKEPASGRTSRYTPAQTALTKEARNLIGKRGRIEVGNVRFNADCSGTVLAIFYAAGLDLRPGFNRSPGSGGVEKLHSLMKSAGLLEKTDLPQPGSLVFWDDTYDRNGDGKKNDSFSHIGLIVAAESDGDLRYVHYHYRKGVVEERMNLRRPSEGTKKSGGVDVVVNSPLRMKSWRPDAAFLSGELYRIGARSYEYEAASGKAAGTQVGLLF